MPSRGACKLIRAVVHAYHHLTDICCRIEPRSLYFEDKKKSTKAANAKGTVELHTMTSLSKDDG
jgi:hypothetical protein